MGIPLVDARCKSTVQQKSYGDEIRAVESNESERSDIVEGGRGADVYKD